MILALVIIGSIFLYGVLGVVICNICAAAGWAETEEDGFFMGALWPALLVSAVAILIFGKIIKPLGDKLSIIPVAIVALVKAWRKEGNHDKS